jgi:hypothetical protein
MHRQSCCKPSVWMNPLPVLVAAQPTPKQKKPQTRRKLAVDLVFEVGKGCCLGISSFLEWVVRGRGRTVRHQSIDSGSKEHPF